MKRFLFLCLAALTLQLPLHASYDAKIDGIYYNFDSSNQTATVTCYSYNNSNNSRAYTDSVTIPEFVMYNNTTYVVTSIGDYAFLDCTSLTKVTIPNSVTSIGNGAFEACHGLTEVTIPNSVTSIGDDAFSNCGITSVVIPNSVTSIGSWAFNSCKSLTSVTIPNSVTSIGDYAFAYCSGITEITIPSSVTSIGNYVFYDCTNLTKVTIPNSVTSIGEYAFSSCNKSLTSVTIPNSVTSIGSSAFRNCSSLTEVTIGNSVDSIGEYAFYNCTGLSTVSSCNPTPPTCETNVFSSIYSRCTLAVSEGSTAAYASADVWSKFTNIVEMASEGEEMEDEGNSYVVVPDKEGKPSLELKSWDKGYTGELTVPSEITKDGVTYTITSIADSAFMSCSGITRLTIPGTVTSIGRQAFYLCVNITEITIVNNITVIGDFAFQGCDKLKKVVVPKSVTDIGEGAFRDCPALENIDVDSENEKYISQDGVLYNKDMSELICVPAAGPSGKFTVPSTVTRVWGYAFQLNVSITEVTISNNVTVIGDFAFEGCDKLRKIFIPGSVKEIGEGAFRECPALECLEVDEGSEDFCSRDSVLYSKDMSELLRVPAALPFEGGFEMPSSVTTIESHAFYQCVNITKVTIVRNVTVIGKLAFGGCTALKEIASVNPEPPVCEPDAFDDVDKDNCTLVVPEGAKEKYAAADVWKDFPNIVEDPSLGVSAAPATVNEASRYTLDGKQVNAPQKGVNIIRYANGSVKKVIVK